MATNNRRSSFCRMEFEGKCYRVHRAIVMRSLGYDYNDRPTDSNGKLLFAVHLCDRPNCVRLSHLELSTPSINTRYSIIRNRRPDGAGTRVFTRKEIRIIISLLSSGVWQSTIADAFDCHPNTIRRVSIGESYCEEIGRFCEDCLLYTSPSPRD